MRALQQYLNYISNTYTEIPKIAVDGVFGPSTESALSAFIDTFGINASSNRVTAPLWNAITNVYDDLYVGNTAREGQYPGAVTGET